MKVLHLKLTIMKMDVLLHALSAVADEPVYTCISQRWTPENDAELTRLFLAGLHVDVIAKRINRTKAAVNVRLSAPNLGLRRKPPANRGWAEEAYDRYMGCGYRKRWGRGKPDTQALGGPS